MHKSLSICLLAVALYHAPAPAHADGSGVGHRAWADDLLSEWVAETTHERGADVTGFELAGLQLFMTYDEVIERLQTSAVPAEITETQRVTCVDERIEEIKSDTGDDANCIEHVIFTLRHGDGDVAHVKAEFSEDVHERPGTSIVVKIEYTRDYGQESAEIEDIYDSVAREYGYEPQYAHLKTYIGHFRKMKSYPYVESELRLPYLQMFLGSVSPISRYSLVLSAGEALRQDLKTKADQIVRESTRSTPLYMLWGG